jgi:V/A-type H+-transporting ATPase subunit K
MEFLGMMGVAAVLGISAIGSAIGAGAAGQAAIGAWKRAYMANKPAPFLLVAFAGAPLTQTIYGNILLGTMLRSAASPGLKFGAGVIGGLAIAMSAIAQGKAAAAGCDAFGETGKGFAQYITVVGICETVALFVMAFLFGAL